MWVCGAASRWPRPCAPVSTPATTPAPARVPEMRSLTVSPATATSSTASISRRSTAVRIMSGAGRPRPASAGDSTRSTSVCQRSASMMRSRVGGAKPVVRHTFTPISRSSANTPVAPGMATTPPASTARAYAASNASLARAARISLPANRCRKTTIFDWPIDSRTKSSAARICSLSSATPLRTIASTNEDSTAPRRRQSSPPCPDTPT